MSNSEDPNQPVTKADTYIIAFVCVMVLLAICSALISVMS